MNQLQMLLLMLVLLLVLCWLQQISWCQQRRQLPGAELLMNQKQST
jgi:hypothetical protein